ncbi:MAG: DNA replication/repair protein RecF [bacterium]
MTEDRGNDGQSEAWLRRLSLRAFRNYAVLDLELDPGLTLIVGPNGHGKTNLVEAVYVLCLGRSFREHRDSRLIRFGDPAARLAGAARWTGREHRVELTWERGGTKQAEVDGARLERLSELLGQLPVVSLTPEDGEIAQGGPDGRRRFMDILLSQTDRHYLEALKRYRRALSQRNASLREGREELARVYEPELARAGAFIQGQRECLARFLGRRASETYRQVSGDGEELGIAYRPHPNREREEYEETLAGVLAETLDRDLDQGYTGTGPHRDDLHLEVGGRPLKTYGSHGQARTALAALKLAEVGYYAESYDRQPLLVMDEAAAVLDRSRADNLIRLLARGSSQVFVTSPGLEDLGPVAERADRIIEVFEGTVA